MWEEFGEFDVDELYALTQEILLKKGTGCGVPPPPKNDYNNSSNDAQSLKGTDRDVLIFYAGQGQF